MSFKHSVARRHRMPRACYSVTDWPAYEAELWRLGGLTLWLDEAALAGWTAPKRSSPGGPPYSELAIGLVLTLRLVFRLVLQQAEAFCRSVVRLRSGWRCPFLTKKFEPPRSGVRRTPAPCAGQC